MVLTAGKDHTTKLYKINRFEVINDFDGTGRDLVKWDDNLLIEWSVQDDGRTLKVFLTKRKP